MLHTVHTCVCCHNDYTEREMIRVSLANRASHDNRGTAFICANCAGDTAPRKARNNSERGAETVTELEYRFTIPATYTAKTRAEFCGKRSGWLACDGAIKSPKYANMKWQRKFETLDKLIERGELELTGDIYVSVIRHGAVLKCTATEYNGKSDFLAFVRKLVDEHKAAIYTEIYGKPFHYGKL